MTSALFSSDETFAKNSVTVTEPKRSSLKTIKYIVNGYETLSSIAKTCQTTTPILIQLNKLSSETLHSGQVLLIPFSDEASDYDDCINSSVSKSDKRDVLSPSSPSPHKQFKDLMIVSSSPEASEVQPERKPLKQTHSPMRSQSESAIQRPGEDLSSNLGASDRRRFLSCNSSQSESLEENFVKMPVDYITGYDELVNGILLITPTSAMFDPDPTCNLVVEYGCERFGIMCNLLHLRSIAVYDDTKLLERTNITSKASNRKTDGIECSVVDESSPEVIDSDIEIENRENVEETTKSEGHVFEFPLLQTLVKTVEDYLPGITQYAEGKIKPKVPHENEKKFLYLCLKSQEPMVRTFSLVTVGDGNVDGRERNEEDVRECWFKFPSDRSEQLFAFFMQWSPDSYALDFAEENGFIDAESVVEKKPNKPIVAIQEEETRSRSSTNSSLVFIEDYFSDKEIKKEWELISVKEAERRIKLNANELANDDSSLMPELLHKSTLIEDSTLLELCRHLPARCIGCPWSLLYSTFEHGISLQTLYRRMNQRYEDSPAVVVVKDSNGQIFGALCSTRPRISDHFSGSGESFLFTLRPEFKVFEWTGENNFFMKGGPEALMFGGGDGTAGLWLDGDLYHGRSKPCLTFNNTILSSSEDFYISEVEVWGFENS